MSSVRKEIVEMQMVGIGKNRQARLQKHRGAAGLA